MRRRNYTAVCLLTLTLSVTAFAAAPATNPSPHDGGTGVLPEATLSWTAGDYVAAYTPGQQTNGHHIFIHTNQAYVTGASLLYPLGTVAGHYRADSANWSPSDPVLGWGGPLAAEKTYYWRIIEVNTVNPSSPWTGDVWSFSTIGPQASNPNPANAQVGVPLDVTLTWTAGTRVGSTPTGGHDVYFSTSQTDVANAVAGAYQGRFDDAEYTPATLDLETVYYWRVDEVNDTSGTVAGPVWRFTAASLTASGPNPANNAAVAELYNGAVDVTLSWKAGAYASAADGHDVYFSTSEYLAKSTTPESPDPYGTYLGRQTTTSIQLEDLALDTTYYWRIDEVNDANADSPWKGQLWSFRTSSGKAWNPNPSDDAERISINVTLSWTAGAAATSHDVYLGTSLTPPFITNRAIASYTATGLERQTTYYWRIDERNSAGVKQGDLWSFTTSANLHPVVTIDQSTTYQTIDGFGAAGEGGGYAHDPALLDMIIDDLGLTILRMEYLPTDEFPTHFMNNQAPFLQAIKAKADASGEPLKFIASYWSPPAWMKDNGSTINGGSVLPAYYDDLGDYSVQTIQDYNSIGIDLYALSIQNEPAFVEPYRSCVYTREQYRDMIKIAGPIIHAAFPDVKLFGAEDVLWPQEYPATCFEQALIDDSGAFAQMGIWALHGYGGDGSLPDPGSAQAEIWNYAKNRFEPTGKHCWMTETSGYWDDWPDCMNLAQSMYASLKFGHISAAVWWRLDVDASYWFDETLIYQGNPTRRYYISKQYYRYIRPDAVMVKSASDNSNLLVAAFKHPQQRTSTIVLINASEQDKTVELNINGDILPNEYNVYRTTATEDCIPAGTAMHNGSVFMPASSVVTLYGTDLCPDCDHVPDGIINMGDLAELGSQWGQVPTPPPYVDVAPAGGDGAVDILDLTELSRCWLKEVGGSQ